MAVTFDDLPANAPDQSLATQKEVMGGLIAALARTGIPAIGFVNEVKLYSGDSLDAARVSLLVDWHEAGYELGNHTYSHPDLHTTPLADYLEEIRLGETVTKALLEPRGGVPRYFRHPMLHTGRSLGDRQLVEELLDSLGYRVAPVTIDNQEWIFARAYDHAILRRDESLRLRIRDAYLIYMDRIVRYYQDQSYALLGYELPQILLLHANRLAVDTVEALIGAWRERGYTFESVDEALKDPAYRMPDEYTGPAGITWLHRWALTRGESGTFFAGEPDVPDFVQQAFRDVPR